MNVIPRRLHIRERRYTSYHRLNTTTRDPSPNSSSAATTATAPSPNRNAAGRCFNHSYAVIPLRLLFKCLIGRFQRSWFYTLYPFLVIDSGDLRHAESRLPKAVPANTVLQVRLAEPHDARGILPFAVRRPGAAALHTLLRDTRRAQHRAAPSVPDQTGRHADHRFQSTDVGVGIVPLVTHVCHDRDNTLMITYLFIWLGSAHLYSKIGCCTAAPGDSR